MDNHGFYRHPREAADDGENLSDDCNRVSESEEDNCDLTQEELQDFIFAHQSQYPDFERDDDKHESASGEYEPIDYSQREEQTQDPCHYPDSKRQRIESFPKDTDEQCSLDVDGVQRIFKKGESFTAKGSQYTGYVFTIECFLWKDSIHREARCRVSMPLEKTIIGKTESKRLKKEFGITHATLRNDKGMLLRKLDKLCEAPNTFLVYEEPRSEAKGVGWSGAFARFGSKQKVQIASSQNPTTMDAFAGVGGMSTGLQAAGFDVICAVEKNPLAAAVTKVNHGKTEVLQEDVRLVIEKLEKEYLGYQKFKVVKHIHASPPCQGFSRANRSGGKNDKANNDLCFAFLELVKVIKPDTGTFENVTGMLLPKNFCYVQELITGLIMQNYQVRFAVVDSSHYGDAQSRSRFFLMIAKDGLQLPDLPPPTHGEGLLPLKTVSHAIGDLESISPTEGSGMVTLPGGKVIFDHEKDDLGTSNSEKLQAKKPAPTVRCGNPLKHPSLERNLTPRERARLQSFPDGYMFFGTRPQKEKQIGNAVPINLATAIGKAVRDCYVPLELNTLDWDDFSIPSERSNNPRRVSGEGATG